MILAHLFATLAPRWNLQVVLAYVDHGLRTDTDSEWTLVETFARNQGWESFRLPLEADWSSRSNVQERARQLRYAALEELRQRLGLAYLVTAHHADDQAESLLLHLFRGTGVKGLAGMRERQGVLLRPLLAMSREDLDAYAAQVGVSWIEDPSNATDHYARNALRHHVLPAIRTYLNPGITDTLADTSRLFASLSDFLERHADSLASICLSRRENAIYIAVAPLNEYLDFERMLVFGRALTLTGSLIPPYSGTMTLMDLLSGTSGRSRSLNAEWIAIRHRTELVLRPSHEGIMAPVSAVLGCSYSVGNRAFRSVRMEALPTAFSSDPDLEYCDAAVAGEHWILRPASRQDRFQPLGRESEVFVFEFLARQGIPQDERVRVPVLEKDGRILWVCGIRLDHRVRLTADSRQALQWSFRPTTEPS